MRLPLQQSRKPGPVSQLPLLPSHWTAVQLRRLISVQSGDILPSSEETEDGFPVIGGNGIRGYTHSANSPADSLVIGRVGAHCGNVHHIPTEFWATEHAFRVRARRVAETRYLYWALTSLDLNRFAIRTAQPLLNTTLVETQWLALPPIGEQAAIGSFLDRETAKIDALVAEQERLIALLQEKRQAVISHAVTKGLNPNVPMKDSGVPWIGEVPRHWRVERSRRLFRPRNERMRPDDVQLTASQKYGIIPQSEFMEREDSRVMQVIKGADILKHVEPGDFIISMRSFQGGLERSFTRGCVSSAYVPLIPADERTSDFFGWVFKSASYIQALQSTTNLVRDGQALRYANFVQVDLPFPSLEEMGTIARKLTEIVERADDLSVEAARMVDLLRERRTALITAAVTGQIDVRGLVDAA